VTLDTDLRARSGGQCELCRAEDDLIAFAVPPTSDGSVAESVLICEVCRDQIHGTVPLQDDRWHTLTNSMWSQVPAVQVMAWRMLRRLRAQAWAADALDMLYLEDDVRAWAEAGDTVDDPASALDPAATDEATMHRNATVHRDANGTLLAAGDTVTLIKDLAVKGAGFTAKRGTAVRGISLVQDNAAHIEGRVNGQQIVILTEFVKKSG
jgi:protein PhnA